MQYIRKRARSSAWQNGEVILSFWFSLDCGCTPEGTQNDGAVEICDDVSGECSCETGYTGDKCNECDAGYYDDQTNTTTTLSCTG